MSFDEMASLLKADNEKQKRELERDRMQWFYSLVAPGFSKATKPTDLLVFDWEKAPKKQGRKLTKEELTEKETKAKKWLGKAKRQ